MINSNQKTKAEQNPYVGARTFEPEESELFFGREREAFDLLSLVIADRLVLFYAQSGAGKSSLINTRVIPGLLKEGEFKLLPVGRLRRDEVTGAAGENVFVHNLLTSLTKAQVNEDSLAKLSISDFLEHMHFTEEHGYFYDKDLAGNVFSMDETESYKYVLIIDQFEELFTTYEEEWRKRKDFFEQLAAAMKKFPRLWVALVMREDYIAYLDPYLSLLPGMLRTRYYMQRLSTHQAIEAVEGPARKRGRTYAPKAAKTLVDALSQVFVRGPDNESVPREGQYVEPVQLQVVCSSLWNKLEEDVDEISLEHVETYVKDLNQALGNFYQDEVQAVASGRIARERKVKERDIRRWFEKELIIDGKRRNMVAQKPGGKSGGLDDRVVQELIGSLVREEKRSGGTTFYELTHDRMVEPIIENNRDWETQHLSPLQRQAALWKEQNENEGWLLSDQALVDVEEWARKNPDEVDNAEREFLNACRERQEQIQLNEQVRSAQRLRRFLTVVGILGLFAVIAAVLAISFAVRASQQSEMARQSAAAARAAEAQANTLASQALAAQAEADAERVRAIELEREAQAAAAQALAGNLVAQADTLKNSNYPLALLLGIEAFGRDPNLLTRTTLFKLLQFTPYTRHFDFTGPISSVAVSPDGRWVAVASCSIDRNEHCSRGSVRLFQVQQAEKSTGTIGATLTEISDLGDIRADLGIVYSVALHQYQNPDRLVLATGGCVPDGCSTNRGQITLWDLSEPQSPVLLDDTRRVNQPEFTHRSLVKTIAFSPSGDALASGSYDTTIVLWSVSDKNRLTPLARYEGLQGHSSFVNSVAFSPDGKILLSAGDDRSILLWDVQPPYRLLDGYIDLPAPVNSIAFSPTEDKFASAGDDNNVLLWNWNSALGRLQETPAVLKGHAGYVKSVSFNADGTRLASTGFDSRVILWDTENAQQIGAPLSVHSAAVNSVAFGQLQWPYLISGANDRTIIQWDVSSRRPLSRSFQPDTELANDGNNPEASNNSFSASTAGQQVDVRTTDTDELFLTLDGFDTSVQYVEFQEQNLLTMDQNQAALGRVVTSWTVDPEVWVELACDAIRENLDESALAELWSELEAQMPAGQTPVQQCIEQP